LALRQVAFDDEGQKKQPVVPERADVAFVRRSAHDVSVILQFEAQSARPDLQKTMAKSDQPSRAPAFDFHDGKAATILKVAAGF